MPRYIAFLRAINVGGHTVKMDHLKTLFEEPGFTGVETFIASGNVVFDSPARGAAALEKRIEEHLEKSLGYEVATFLRTPARLAEVADHRAFDIADDDMDGRVVWVAFLKEPPGDEAVERLMSHRSDLNDFHLNDREIYWLRRPGVNDPKFSGDRMERALKTGVTVRNITTVRKLVAKYPAPR